jgi:predicted  nucleic acid-binding Zn-ribbon protein
MGVVRQLYQLQLVDSDQAQKSLQLERAVGALGASVDLIRAREAVTETEGSLGELSSEMRIVELDISAVSSKLKQNQDRLYSGHVKNPKELAGLQEEAAALRRRMAELEDGQLDLMISTEESEAEAAERGARLRQIETSWMAGQSELMADRDALETSLVELAETRENMRNNIPASDLDLYDDLRSRYGGVAVVRLKRGICQTCGVDVPTGVTRSVERGDGLHYCPTCNRLLYGS